MKRPSQLVNQGRDTSMDAAMTPMIDVVFLLLVFFVWTASFQIIEQILPSQMSAQMGAEPSELSEPPPEADFENIVIRIRWDNGQPAWQLNDNPVISIDQLNSQLAAISAVKIDAPVILHPDQIVPLGNVIEVYDLSKLAGFEKISFAITPETM